MVYKDTSDFDQGDKWRFHLKSDTNQFIGVHEFLIEVHSDVMKLEPNFNFVIKIEILPCKVRDTNLLG